jgi:glucose-6-phosphate isomerase
VQSVVWGVNAFDQWGVELGKKLCERTTPLVRAPGAAGEICGSLRGALEFVASVRG